MNSGHQRQAHGLQLQHPVAETLVIVDEIVFVTVLAQVFHRAPAEGVRFGEAAGELAGPLDDVAHRTQVVRPQRQQAVLEQVHARQLDKPDPRVQVRIRRPGNHIHPMAGIYQRLAQVADVHALPSAVRRAAIPQQRNSQRAGGCALRGRGDPWLHISRCCLNLPDRATSLDSGSVFRRGAALIRPVLVTL